MDEDEREQMDANIARSQARDLTLLSQLLFVEGATEEIERAAAGLTLQEFDDLCDLANSHHVVLRALDPLRAIVTGDRAEWVQSAIVSEQARIANALAAVEPVCLALGAVGDVIVIKSLDHWPDLGNDIDLYTNAKAASVVELMRKDFNASLAERSWGDRLANKWNFMIPGLPELVEVHVGRLGQTGEQVAITKSLVARSRAASFGSRTFRVAGPEDRLIISTLQRMYRHFYFRLCDIVDTALLVESHTIDYGYLESLARAAGLWDGVATYLAMVSNYVKSYRGTDLPLPPAISSAARFDTKHLPVRRKFLRVPLFPHGASFYAAEWKKLLFKGEFRNTLRLSLLPSLAVAAALELKLSGSDKGIW